MFYLLTLALLVPPAMAASLRSGMRNAPLVGALAGTAVVLMPGALGRADPPHVLLYGLGPSLLLLLALANSKSARPLACFAAGYIVVSVALFNLVNLINFLGPPVDQFARDPIGATRSFLAAQRAEFAPRDLSFLSELDKYPGIGVPFATYGPEHEVEAYLFRKRLLAPEYFIATIAVYTADDLARKIADVGPLRYLLVSGVFQHPWKGDRCTERLRRLRRWYLYPARLACVREDLDSHGDILRFIAANFEPIERLGPVVVMRRVASESAPGRVTVTGSARESATGRSSTIPTPKAVLLVHGHGRDEHRCEQRAAADEDQGHLVSWLIDADNARFVRGGCRRPEENFLRPPWRQILDPPRVPSDRIRNPESQASPHLVPIRRPDFRGQVFSDSFQSAPFRMIFVALPVDLKVKVEELGICSEQKSHREPDLSGPTRIRSLGERCLV